MQQHTRLRFAHRHGNPWVPIGAPLLVYQFATHCKASSELSATQWYSDGALCTNNIQALLEIWQQSIAAKDQNVGVQWFVRFGHCAGYRLLYHLGHSGLCDANIAGMEKQLGYCDSFIVHA
jgi:hypothetical protein